MSLQFALALIGLLIVTVIAITALDKARANRLFHLGFRSRATVRTPGLGPRLDVNPAPPAEDVKKFLSTDAPVEPKPATAQERIVTQLESLEEVATMPLDLDLGVGRGRRPRPVPAWEATAPDERIDFVIYLGGGTPVSRDAPLGVFKQNEYLLDKPRYLVGRHAKTGQWSNLGHDSSKTSYAELAIGIQLVDSRGPIDESELNTFSQIGLKLADALQRSTRFSLGFEEALARARQLHAFCDTFDVIAGINVLAQEGVVFQGRAIEQAARKHGLSFGAMNIFHMKDALSPASRHQFSMANLYQPGEFDPQAWDTTQTRGLTLFMSVPCAHRPSAVLDKMVTTARGLCDLLHGELYDQERRPLTDKGVAVIRHQVEEIEDKMRAQGIVAGSETALRLFRMLAAPEHEPAPGA
jgi:hypothetical protein